MKNAIEIHKDHKSKSILQDGEVVYKVPNTDRTQNKQLKDFVYRKYGKTIFMLLFKHGVYRC